MDDLTRREKLSWLELIDTLKGSELSDLDKVVQAFRHATDEHVKNSQRDVELARALKDRKSVIREQIKQETIKYTQKVLNDCYTIFIGRRAWDE